MKFEEYGQTVRVTGSLRSYLGLPVYHGTDETVDAWLKEHHFKKLIVFLIDAMGTSVLEKHLSEDDFLKKHMVKSVSTVFPPTTSAATTAIRTGKYPCETGWLGWNQYFKEKDDNIILFLNRSQYGEGTYPNFSYEALPVSFTEQQLKEDGDSVWPGWSGHNPCSTFEDMWKKLIEMDEKETGKYIYAYWDAFDTLMHRQGPSSFETKQQLREISSLCERYASKLSETTGLVIIADHSQIDVEKKHLDDHPEIVECFEHLPALEPRTIGFYIREEKKEFFVRRFMEVYGHDFDLYTKKEVFEKQIFGNGETHERLSEFTGDFVAIAKGTVSLTYHNSKTVKGDHAGGLEEEAMVPLILYPQSGEIG